MKIESNMKIINKNGLVAVGSITLDEIITIKNIKVLDFSTEEEREKGTENWKIVMPQRKGKEGWNGVIFLRNPEIREKIEEKVYEGIRKNLVCDLGMNPLIEISITLYKKDTLVGYANILYEKMIEIRGIQIHEEETGIRLKLPYNIFDGKFESLIDINTESMTELIKKEIEDAYMQTKQQREMQKTGRKSR